MLSLKIMSIPNEDRMLIELNGVQSSEQDVLANLIQGLTQVLSSQKIESFTDVSTDFVPLKNSDIEINEKEYQENESVDLPDFVKEAEEDLKNNSSTLANMDDYCIIDLPYGTATDKKNRQIILKKTKEKNVSIVWNQELKGYLCKKDDINNVPYLKKYIRK